VLKFILLHSYFILLLLCGRFKSRTESPTKTKIGTEVAYVTRDSDTIFKVKRSKVNLQGAGHIVAASRTACLHVVLPVRFP